RFAHRVEDPTEPQWRRPHLVRGIGDHRAATAPHAFEAGEWHHHGVIATEPDDLAGDQAIAAGLDHDTGADRHRMNRAGDLHHQAPHANHAAINIDAIDIADLLGEC